LGLDINIRTSERNGTSYISSAVIKIGSDKIEIQEDGSYYWNDQHNIPLPSLFGDSKLTYVVVDGWLPMWTMTSPRGGTIFVQIFDVMVDVKISGFSNESVSDSVGLMGDYDSGFLVNRRGDWMFNIAEFGNDWQVRDTEPMLFHEVQEPQYPSKCRMPLKDDVDRRLRSLGNISEEEATMICSESGKYFEDCVEDIQLMGNRETGRYYKFLASMEK
jgi:hypothetical protein